MEDAGRVAGLILVDPLYSPDQLMPTLRFLKRRPDLGEKALRYTPLWLIHLAVHFDLIDAISFPKETRRQIAIDYKRASPHVLYIPRSIPDMTSKVQDILHPALVIWGEKDRTLEPGSFTRLLDLMPNAYGYPLPECGHQPHISRPSEVSRITLEFILTRLGRQKHFIDRISNSR
jgi:pimeloyl-ACP methyl ester carboxylesterase